MGDVERDELHPPKVAAVIADEAARLGISTPEAWKRLSHYRHFRYPDLGIVFNVL